MSEDDAATDEVRRLLADARASEPMPADVQSRLEDVLNTLSAERVASAAPAAKGVIVDLASRRRSRVKTLLIAAAAVTVLGVAVPPLLQNGFSTSDDEGSASSADTAAESDAGGNALTDGTDAGSGSALEDAPGRASEPANADVAIPSLRPGNFADDAQAARDQAARSGFTALTPIDPKCLAGSGLTADLLRELKSIPVRYGRQDGALVLGEPRKGSQEATLYICGESSPRRTTMLSAR